ncbi:MAG: hypothetical protein QN122_04595 [Armatimonadota bacterium]|nr:hypothetical protein [Armatimonadota bacterium]MDR7449450.1 hypothetical protein [Armatimonadota bacterium]MDR7458823.1 hypothetical protein [Armatimonadota bacterium]MDR7480039.1 hypothetical protein [Armatimonadota bacterium]MDR7488455.1 hypothetical protein [Armatimonadota bacterium]
MALFHVGLVVLAILPGAWEREALGATVGEEGGVDEGAVMVGIDARQGEGEPMADDGERLKDMALVAVDHGAGLEPRGRNVHHREAVEVLATRRLAAVGDSWRLERGVMGPVGPPKVASSCLTCAMRQRPPMDVV